MARRKTEAYGAGALPREACQGAHGLQFSQAYTAGKGIVAGTSVHAQYGQRDPEPIDGTGVGLTDARAFDVVP